MIKIDEIDYSILDHPGILSFLFHPRPDLSPPTSDRAEDLLIPVGNDIVIGARMHHAGKKCPIILFFHGNGEVVSDYDDVGPVYAEMGINFLPVDYRGYGASTGTPTVTDMMRDSHYIFNFVKNWLNGNSFTGPIILMGRSLGSASALEIAANYPDDFKGLIIESGFAFSTPLLKLLGADLESINFHENKGLGNIEKIRNVFTPVLIIHAEYDHIIPFSDGEALYNSCKSSCKKLLTIPDADHNTIFYYGAQTYLKAIQDLSKKAIN